jgi:hypothetical protein
LKGKGTAKIFPQMQVIHPLPTTLACLGMPYHMLYYLGNYSIPIPNRLTSSQCHQCKADDFISNISANKIFTEKHLSFSLPVTWACNHTVFIKNIKHWYESGHIIFFSKTKTIVQKHNAGMKNLKMFLRDFTDTCMECGSILLEPCNSRID